MQIAIWQTLLAYWRDCSFWPEAAKAAREQRQIEHSIREHGTFWLIDQRYADVIPASVPDRSRPKPRR